MKERLLIADDSPMNRQLLAELLGEDYTYLFAENGICALEHMESSTDIDLLLLDIHMPVLDGFGVLEMMQRRRWLEEIPVIIISSEDDDSLIQRAYDLGATDFIRRPFNHAAVQWRVRNTLILYSRQKRLAQLVEQQVLEREKTNSAMVNILSHVIESRNNESGLHLLHVRTLTELLLRELTGMTDRYALSEADISMITTLSALHDIGKISIPSEILNKPGKLTQSEWEIMQSHAAIGDALLTEVPIDQNEPLMQFAHAICRHHHERWDGRGYPDALAGDAIPISAQVVSLADVYDALTSERCYKKAFTHEKAIEMILGGECGSFNPLLLACLQRVAPQLQASMRQNPADFDYGAEARRLTKEMFSQARLPLDNRIEHLLFIERSKSDFYARLCGGIQFEYDSWLGKSVRTDWDRDSQQRHIRNYVSGDGPELLDADAAELLRRRLSETTREHPDLELELPLHIGQSVRWHLLRARTIWGKSEDLCEGTIGQFVDIHEQVSLQSASALSETPEQAARSLQTLKKYFGLVRLVDPDTCHVLASTAGGALLPTPERCYCIWKRDEACINCTSALALNGKSWASKLEIMENRLYFVLSHALTIGDRAYVLEIAAPIDECGANATQPAQFGAFLTNFYRDPLTHAYSRLYFESFLSTLEQADGVAILDVDQLKQINDTWGHLAGDDALQHIAGVIQACLGPQDTFVRYGGDEFLLLLTGLSEEDFYRKLDQLAQAVHESRLRQRPELRLEISVGGVYRVHPLQEAIRQADEKMYRFKASKAAAQEDLTR